MRILAIDLGSRRAGLAVSDPLGYTAQGLKTIERMDEESFLAEICGICYEKKVSECVVGLPLRMNGEAGMEAIKVREWISRLRSRLECPVVELDERLTTRQAQRILIEQDMSRRKQKQKNDQIAAILLLQNYLDQKRQTRDAGAA